MPGSGDDVVIDTSNGDITVTISSETNSINSLVCQETLQLNGGTLAVSTSAQLAKNLMLSGGTILGGTVVTTNEALLVVGSGTLDGVTVTGTLDVGNSVNGVTLTVMDGLTLNGTMLVGNPTNNTYGTVSFAGSQVLGGNGTVVFGSQPYNSMVLANAGTTLVVGPGITVHGQNGSVGYNPLLPDYQGVPGGASDAGVANQGTIAADVNGGTITIAGGNLSNAGTLAATNGGTLQLSSGSTMNSGTITEAGGTMTLHGSWSNSGVIQGNGGTLNLGGSFTLAAAGTLKPGNGAGVNLTGTLNNSNTTLVVDGAVAPWVLSGTILGGTVVTTNGASLVVGSGTLDGVTVAGTLDVGNVVDYASLTVTNGLTLNGTLVGNPTNQSYGAVSFAGSQVLGGNGTVVFGNHYVSVPVYGNNIGYNSLYVANGGTTLVIGPGITVHGQSGWIGYNLYTGGSTNGIVANQGTISADVGGGTITIAGGMLSNSGTLEAQDGGVIQPTSAATINTGTIAA